MKARDPSGGYWSVRTVAALLDCSPRTVWRMVQRGDLPALVVVPGLAGRRFRRVDVETALGGPVARGQVR